MKPTSFFLLTLLLVLVTEATGRKKEKHSQLSEELGGDNDETDPQSPSFDDEDDGYLGNKKSKHGPVLTLDRPRLATSSLIAKRKKSRFSQDVTN
ncbi:Svs4 [Phodopus roborovskii]|uniref:Svs4 protein n=1 Tax=Phodopus roborovskii TaxID=109678 RepID=A0AAU9YN95_PHORO|nr:Svs4 [Phodopus roborovskii]